MLSREALKHLSIGPVFQRLYLRETSNATNHAPTDEIGGDVRTNGNSLAGDKMATSRRDAALRSVQRETLRHGMYYVKRRGAHGPATSTSDILFAAAARPCQETVNAIIQ